MELMKRVPMKKLMTCLIAATALSPLGSGHAETLNLSGAYQKAVEYDSRYRAAQAENLVYKEEVDKAKSQFRPTVRASSSRGRNSTQHAAKGFLDPTQYYNTIGQSLTVRQSILNLSNIAEYKQSRDVAAKSDAELQKEGLGLMVRIAEAYCNALYGEDNIEFSQAHIRSSLEQLNQAKKRYEKGFGTITEIKESQANYDMAVAEGLDIANSAELARRELEVLTGVYPDRICRLVPEKLTLNAPSPARVESWVELALSKNPLLSAARKDASISKREIEKQRAMRYPTIDLVAGRNYSVSENNYSIGSTYDTYSIGLQLNVPIYSGGYTSAAVRQAHAKWVKAGELLNGEERAVESDVRKYYNSVIASIAQINAYLQAMQSQEVALTGTRKGYEAGLRSNVDVLEAEQKLLASRRNLAKSRYQYILNFLMLRQSAGTLSSFDLDEVNGWLAATGK